MTTSSQHPELPAPDALRDAIERVQTGIERAIVLTDAQGKALAALVPLEVLRQLDARDVAQRDDAAMEESDTAGMHRR